MESAIKLLIHKQSIDNDTEADDYMIIDKNFDENSLKLVFELTLRVVNSFKNGYQYTN